MDKKFEMPYLDKAIGLGTKRKQEQGEFEKYLTKKIEVGGGKFINDLELEKSERDKEIIDFVIAALEDYLNKYNRKKNIKKPIQNIHVLKNGGVEEYTKGRFKEGAYANATGGVIVDRKDKDIEFALRLFHELFHGLSYQAIQEVSEGENRKIESYRSGFSVYSRDGKSKYFDNLEEAVVSKMTKRFFEEKILKSDFFSEDEKNKEVKISRSQELEELNALVNDLWEREQNNFNSKEEIFDLFIDAQVNGNLLKVGRLIEKNYGKGSFRSLAKNELNI